MSDTTDLPTDTTVQTLIETGRKLATIDCRVKRFDEPDPDDPTGDIPVVLLDQGSRVEVLTQLMKVRDELRDGPRRRRGTAVFTEEASFVAHVNRFKTTDSVIFADTTKMSLVAVLNYHPSKSTGWGDHRSYYACPLSRQWKLWMSMHDKPLEQEAFAQWIDDNMRDLANPDCDGLLRVDFPQPGKVLDLARRLELNVDRKFKRQIHPETGAVQLIDDEQHSSPTPIPRAFLLRLPVFDEGTVYAVEVRLKVRIQGGKVVFIYSLHEYEELLRTAFGEVRERVGRSTTLPILAGAPE